ncbi:unnamed protein product [Calypogeia fissa]
MMKRSMRASKQILEDDEEEDWGRETGLKVRAARILGPRESLVDTNHVSKKRLRKIMEVNDNTPSVSSAEEPTVTTRSRANPFENFSFQRNPRKKADRGISLRSPPLPAETKKSATILRKDEPPKIPSEAFYDGSMSWLESIVVNKEESARKKNEPAVLERDESPVVKVDEPAVVEEKEEEEDEEDLVIGDEGKRGSRRRKFAVALSSDDEEDFEILPGKPTASSSERNGSVHASTSGAEGNGVIDLDDYDDCTAGDEAIARALQEEEFVELGNGHEEEPESNEEVDLIYSTLEKCDRIAAELRQDLHGSAVHQDRYAEVDPGKTKLVTQTDICAACDISSANGQILKPYQLVGVNFMMLLSRKKVGGAILADEMGLGKTVQAVAFLALLKHLDNDPGPHMIVCPASLLENWQRELQKWCPSFKVVLFHGNDRASLIREFKEQRKAGNDLPFNVMLTCYTLFERRSAQQKDDRKFLRKWNWSCVLMDEAHFLKDRDSLRTTRLREVAHKARQRVMLTGTPLQNDLQELWALLEFLLPDIFNTGKADLTKLLGSRNTAATAFQEEGDIINHMKSILGPFVLRRLKSDVMQQLVPKIHKVECIAMEPDQALAYQEAVVEYKNLTTAARAARKEADQASQELGVPRKQIQNIFTQLRKIANHPLLVRRLYSDQDVEILSRKLHAREVFGNQCTEERVIEELSNYNDFTLYQLCIQNGLSGPGFGAKLTDEHVLGSAKCQVLSRLLTELKKDGHRPLIFSQWTQMLDILEWACDVMGLTYVRLDGSTQVRERQEIVDSFNNDPSIFLFLLSTRAGGQGLNLVGADTVIIHDVDFNPQMDRQAEDRCHRIGQLKPVTVYRLVTKGSVDESIYNIAQRKLVLDAAVLESGGAMSRENGEPESDAQTMEEILSAILAAVPS